MFIVRLKLGCQQLTANQMWQHMDEVLKHNPVKPQAN